MPTEIYAPSPEPFVNGTGTEEFVTLLLSPGDYTFSTDVAVSRGAGLILRGVNVSTAATVISGTRSGTTSGYVTFGLPPLTLAAATTVRFELLGADAASVGFWRRLTITTTASALPPPSSPPSGGGSSSAPATSTSSPGAGATTPVPDDLSDDRDPRFLRPNLAVTEIPPESQRTRTIPEIPEEKINKLIEMRGVRLIWTRSASCPCDVNSETLQPDPLCPKCNGTGWFYFGPRDYTPTPEVGSLTRVQKALLSENGTGGVIRGLTQKMQQQNEPYTSVGVWDTSEAMITVRPENKLGYYDRLVNIDSVYPFKEVVQMPSTSLEFLPLKYRAVGVNLVESVARPYYEDEDFTVTEDGRLRFFPSQAPTEDTNLAVHYLVHPRYLVTSHPHAIRNSSELFKITNPRTPLGSPQDLPIQARIHLEFLIDGSEENG